MIKVTKPFLSSIIYKELKKNPDIYQLQDNQQVNYKYVIVISVKNGVLQAGELVEFVDSDVKGLVLNLEKNNVLLLLLLYLFIIFVNLVEEVRFSTKAFNVIFGSNLSFNNNIVFVSCSNRSGLPSNFLYGPKALHAFTKLNSNSLNPKNYHLSLFDDSSSHIKKIPLSFTSSPIVSSNLLANQQVLLNAAGQSTTNNNVGLGCVVSQISNILQ